MTSSPSHSSSRFSGICPSRALAGCSVLIVEDEYLLADDLAQRLENSGAIVVGPSATVEEAIEQFSRRDVLSAAVLDIRLGERLVFPVADLLRAHFVPFVFYSGYDDLPVPARFRHHRRLNKITGADGIVRAVLAEQAIAAALAEDANRGNDPRSGIAALLPSLRVMAMRLTAHREAADGLVAEALEQALARLDQCPPDKPVLRWLLQLTEEAWLRSQRRRFH